MVQEDSSSCETLAKEYSYSRFGMFEGSWCSISHKPRYSVPFAAESRHRKH